jgi:Xaa-Pro dipeptidase
LLSDDSDSLRATASSPLTPGFYRGVLDRIRAKMEAAGREGFLVLDSNNLAYATGFFHRANERPMGVYVPVDSEPVLLVPHLEKENAETNWIVDVRTYPEFPGLVHPVLWMLRETGATRIAVDTLEARLFREAFAIFPLLELSPVIEELRFAKAPQGLALVRLAAGYADACLEHMRVHIAGIVSSGGADIDILQAGVSAALGKMKREIGDVFDGTETAVVGSVHSGPRGALPHGHTTTRRPASGDTIIAGIGATVGGYHAESGATFVLGEASADTLSCLQAAAACDAAAIAALRPGIECHEVNTAALAELQRAGLGEFIRHRIGHGMGVQGHEGPWLAPGDETVVAEGMVFSNEPGIYRPGIDGYRTINTMIVGAGGVEVPSRFQSSFGIEKRILAV